MLERPRSGTSIWPAPPAALPHGRKADQRVCVEYKVIPGSACNTCCPFVCLSIFLSTYRSLYIYIAISNNSTSFRDLSICLSVYQLPWTVLILSPLACTSPSPYPKFLPISYHLSFILLLTNYKQIRSYSQ